MYQQVTNLFPHKVKDTDIIIDCVGYPTLVDGKIKSFWSGNNAFSKCYLCNCGPKDLSERSSDKFHVKDKENLLFGFSPLHIMLRSFDWFLKNKTYSDIRQYSAQGPVQQAYVAAQKRKLQKRMNKHFRVKVFQPKKDLF